VKTLADRARQRWAEYSGPRGFRLEMMTFVQNTEGNNWIDLGKCRLGTGDVQLLEPMAVR